MLDTNIEFTGLKKIYSSKGFSKEHEPSLIEKLYDFTFGSNPPSQYVYIENGSPKTYTEGSIVYIQNTDDSSIVYYKANKDTTEEITDTATDWEAITVATAGSGDIGDAILVSDTEPEYENNKIWFDQVEEVEIEIPDDL